MESSESNEKYAVPALVQDFLTESAVALIAHPLTYSRNMMMVGYEPLPATLVSPTFFFLYKKKQYWMLPNIFRYTQALRYEIGLFNVFTVGYPASLAQKYVKQIVTNKILEMRNPDAISKKSYLVSNRGIKVCLEEAFYLANARIAGVIVAYPFNVILIRQMAEAIKLRGASKSVLSHITRIFTQEGLSSFFNGLGFRIAEEALTVYSVAIFVYALNNYVIPENCDQHMRQYAPVIAAFTISTFTHPLTVVAATMAISGAGIDFLRSYSSSLQCYSSLNKSNQLERGMSTFFRYIANGPL